MHTPCAVPIPRISPIHNPETTEPPQLNSQNNLGLLLTHRTCTSIIVDTAQFAVNPNGQNLPIEPTNAKIQTSPPVLNPILRNARLWNHNSKPRLLC